MQWRGYVHAASASGVTAASAPITMVRMITFASLLTAAVAAPAGDRVAGIPGIVDFPKFPVYSGCKPCLALSFALAVADWLCRIAAGRPALRRGCRPGGARTDPVRLQPLGAI